jgi:predicted nucleic acid-binding protein
MKAIVSDATSLIVLAKLGRVDFLKIFFDQVIIPSQVMGEIRAKPDHDASVWVQEWLRIEDGTQLPHYRAFSQVLDPGESEALALADHRRLPLLIDEKKGRAIAGRRGIPVIGLVGLLLRGVQRQFLSGDEARSWLVEARKIGFCLSDSLARDFSAALDQERRGRA